MMLSSTGEKLYVGETAHLSFLQFLRKTLRQQMGPTPFTESEFSNQMLEVDLGDSRLASIDDPEQLGDKDQKRALIQCYFEASSAILDLYTKEEVFEFLPETGLSPTVSHGSDRYLRDDHAALCLMLAIGAQCRGARASDADYAKKCFVRGQQIAFEGMLCNPSLNMIRLFLLMSFYMLGACHRNAAFIYLGVASKAASALGLHVTEVYRHMNKDERDTRLRAWKSLRNLDLIVCSLLGRAAGSFAQPELDLEENEEQRVCKQTLDATFRVCTIIDDLQQDFAKGGVTDLALAEDYLQRLRAWSQGVPPELRQFTSANAATTDSEHVIGAVHISCIYYYGVILVTRPFLISHLMSKLRRNGTETPHTATTTGDQEKITKLADACLNSAIYMSQTGYQAMESGYLLGNMCLLKAWTFAAGLLLGFALFAQNEDNAELEDAFKHTVLVEKMIANLSPQAGLYADILTKFSDAIERHRRQIKDERRRMTNEYVDQIFTIDLAQQQGYPSPQSGNVDTQGPATNNSYGGEVSFPPDMLPGISDPSPHDLPLDWQPFGMFFEDFWMNQPDPSVGILFG
ncbi:uncharacterized protein AB675_2707 [Cyphellophora attinorum]|uniref:Xylanolytic transcriptional activator regulatory domain-containing protein n=1 Tax=Cyphellophora attinorum TaxID=1664694 RepID=A0A0N1HGW0_9EURO|nr:uncharacterized protein AB675_2707 [Phialophora attinorum]KPI45037.1 hypothetical protein AB675_2707 [Phialophora attinorum]